VSAAESTASIKSGQRNRWFCLFTNTQIDLGFIIGYIVPTVVAAIAPTNYTLIWRLSLGLGVVPPLSLLYLRLKVQETESFSRGSFRGQKTPYWLALKFYGPRLLIVSGIWFIYDFLSYPFSIYSSDFIATILGPGETRYWRIFGWGALVNFFYLPGAVLGAFTSDWMGPRLALFVFVIAQGIVAFIMSGCLYFLEMPQYVGAFVVVYGIFLALGEMGPGDNIGLIASKTSASGIRGQYYGIAAACGKIGAFVGSYVFPIIQNDGGGEDTLKGKQYPFYVAGALCFVAAALVILLPHIGQDTIQEEDARFRAYLDQHGWDTSSMGLKGFRDKDETTVEAKQ
jgi:MFS family permease